ncbi:hypothetical protein Aconfl_04760 [Algoriphagus confluentis]|uniref:Outer membrane protein beta-barrel domain-containing protein n=1 Tax=Algoriphagus confluentis TaxID=1697556 RepID=A0ABQ6PIT5_9BACT|nr:hypothetical protein Aconfl_04760 [Algoriphagus confluentis]
MKPQHKNSFFLILVFTLLLSFDGLTQSKGDPFTAKKAIYLELGGSSGVYGFNYGTIFHQKGKLKLNASAGFSLLIRETSNSRIFWLPAIPLELTALYGKSNHHLEMGFGVLPYLDVVSFFDSESLVFKDKVVFDTAIPLRIGYRYQKPEGGFFFRIGYTPYFIAPIGGREDWTFMPIFGGLSFGKSF